MFPLILALAACQTPFGIDRHRFDGLRIAAMSATNGETGEPVEVSAAIVSNGHLWTAESPEFLWYWLDNERQMVEFDLDDLLEPDGIGPRPDLILPEDTRPRLCSALRLLENKRDSNPPKKHGNIPL